jgi:hypothetical protein
MVDFWVVIPCAYQRFNGTYCLRPQAETLVSTYKSARRYKSEDQHRRLHRRVNLKPHILNAFIDIRTVSKLRVQLKSALHCPSHCVFQSTLFTIAFLGVLQVLQIVRET